MERRIFDKTLPPECYNASRTFSPQGFAFHYISVNTGHPGLVDGLRDWQRFDAATIHAFLVELNRPGPERGMVWKRSDYSRAYGSYHWLISRDGTIFRLVPETHYAYHAGRSRWKGRDNCNSWLYGAALAGPGGRVPYTGPQYNALANLVTSYGYGATDCAAHSRIRALWNSTYPEKAAAPKHDPGPGFDWVRFRETIEEARGGMT